MPYYHTAVVILLVLSVVFVTLMPAFYVLLHALKWTSALQLLEAAFFPALLLAVMAGLLAHQRHRMRHAHGEKEEGE